MVKESLAVDFIKLRGQENMMRYYRLFNNFGLYDGAGIETWVGGLLAKYAGNADITFQDYHDKFGTELIVVACCLNKLQTVYLNRQDNPKMKVRKAIRFSTTIPLEFQSVQDENQDFWIDGGMSDNLAIDCFDGVLDSNSVLGLKLMGPNENRDDVIFKELPFQLDSVEKYITGLIYFSSVLTDRFKVKQVTNYWHRSICLTAPQASVTDFNMSTETRNTCLHQAYADCMEQLHRRMKTGTFNFPHLPQ